MPLGIAYERQVEREKRGRRLTGQFCLVRPLAPIMYSQVKKSWCGPTAISNAMLALGYKVSQKRAGRLCGTTDDGTDEHQIMMGLDLLGHTYTPTGNNARKKASAALDADLLAGRPALLCVDEWGHWVTVIAPPLGARYPYVDPVNGKIKLIHWRTLERRWAASARLQTGPLDTTYYHISIGARK